MFRFTTRQIVLFKFLIALVNSGVMMIRISTLCIFSAFLLMAGCLGPGETSNETGTSNNATIYCQQQGGIVEIRTSPSGDEYGVCKLTTGVQCEQWAYYNGQCGNTTGGTGGNASLPNPASVYCEEQGGILDIRTDESGGQYGICILGDGTECDEWAFYSGECGAETDDGTGGTGGTGDGTGETNGTGLPNPASVYCEEQGGILEIVTDVNGSQYGICTLPGGIKCEEWEFYRGECAALTQSNCVTTADCACGVHKETRECFYGNKEYVDTAAQCPDFCTGIAGNLEIVCSENRCVHARAPRDYYECADTEGSTIIEGEMTKCKSAGGRIFYKDLEDDECGPKEQDCG